MNEFEHERLDVYRAASQLVALDAFRVLVLTDETPSQTGRSLLLRVVAMLTAMVVKISETTIVPGR